MAGQATLALGNFWHPVARSEEVTDKPQRFALLDDFVVAFRHEGELAVFKDMCVHRGAALSLGKVRDGHLVCPYHGWEFNTAGACVRIPSRGEDQPIPELAHAVAYKAQERYGLIWVAQGEPQMDISPFPHDSNDHPDWRSFMALSETWQTSAARLIENFMDFSHFPYVHEGLLGVEETAKVEPYKVTKTDTGLRYVFEQTEPSELYGKSGGVIVEYEYEIHMPYTIHLTKRVGEDRTVLTLIASPTTARTTTYFMFISRNYDFDVADADFADFTVTIMGQDQPVVESQRPEGIPDSLKEELHLMPADNAALVYRQKLLKMAKVEPLGPYGA